MLSIVTCIFWQRSKSHWKLILCLAVTCTASLFQMLLVCAFMVFPALLCKMLYTIKTKRCYLLRIPFCISITFVLHHFILLVTCQNGEWDWAPMEVNSQIQSWACTISSLTRSQLGKRSGSRGSASFLMNREVWSYVQGSTAVCGGKDSAVQLL